MLQVSGISPPKPVASFAHFGFDDALMSSIIKAGYTQPMPIQAQVSTLYLICQIPHHALTYKTLNYFCINLGDQRVFSI